MHYPPNSRNTVYGYTTRGYPIDRELLRAHRAQRGMYRRRLARLFARATRQRGDETQIRGQREG